MFHVLLAEGNRIGESELEGLRDEVRNALRCMREENRLDETPYLFSEDEELIGVIVCKLLTPLPFNNRYEEKRHFESDYLEDPLHGLNNFVVLCIGLEGNNC